MSRWRRCCTPVWAALALAGAAWSSACGDDATQPAADPAVPTTIMVSPDSVELAEIGSSVRLTAQVRDQNGRVMADARVWWRSSNEPVAIVDSTGLVQGVGRGAATIVATASNAQGRAAFTVADPDRTVLGALYRAMDGPNWTYDPDWLTEAGLSRWHGVRVNREGRVIGLALARNGLSGVLPPEFAELTHLETLFLDFNELSGPVPPEFGQLASLRELGLNGNRSLTGPLPSSLTSLSELDALVAGDTELCVPDGAGFLAWLDGVRKRRIASCAGGAEAAVYLTQVVQSLKFPVPLVAGREALVRVFPTAVRATSAHIPLVRIRLYLDGTEMLVRDVAAKAVPIPTQVVEGDWSGSVNVEVSGQLVQPGMEVVVEVDPDGTLDPALGVAQRIPDSGRLAVDVREVLVLDLTVIPFLWKTLPDSAILGLATDMAADPRGHGMLTDTRILLPVGDLKVTAHEPVLTSANVPSDLLSETLAIQAMEGGTGHYLGMMSGTMQAPGVARLGGRASVAEPKSSVVAHELGHNMSLRHAPCGPHNWPDLSFPYSNGSSGAWGYDFRGTGSLVPPSIPDVMSYCDPNWVSDYHFTNSLRFRLVDEVVSNNAAVAAPGRSLLVWGGVDDKGRPFLNPVFVVDAPASLPDSAGDYVVTGRNADGGALFSLSFTMPEVADGNGGSSFSFVLPAKHSWSGEFTALALRGPGGVATLDIGSDRPMVILRNPRTRQVRGILRGMTEEVAAQRDAATAFGAGPDLEVLFSRGIPDTADWRW